MTQRSAEDFFGDITDTVRRLASGELQPVEPRHAATVILLRDGSDGPQVYLLRRTASMSFAAGAFVFPGGSVDPRDVDLADEAWVGATPAIWAKTLSSDESTARALVCAAVRETFEESGVMLAGGADSEAGNTAAGNPAVGNSAGGNSAGGNSDVGNTVVADTSGDDWEADRLALLDRSLSLAELLERRGLRLRADLLHGWTHWLTPEVEPKRFDTRFFVAALPTGQRTRHVGGEADRVAWMRPADAVAGSERGEMMLMPPTLAALRELAQYGSVAEVLADAINRDVQRILPRLILDANDQLKFLLPGDPDYSPEQAG
jgi:8-oxo-dGTP pyrophosphatase MutT (NUDIX family)